MKPPLKRSLAYGTSLAFLATFGLYAVHATMVAAQTDGQGGERNPVLVRDIDTFSREPVQLSDAGGGLGAFRVPDGKMLVIEHVAGACTVPRREGLFNALICTTYPTTAATMCFNLAPVLIGSDATLNYYAFSQPIRMYSKGVVRIDGSSSLTYSPACSGEIAGYLVELLPKG